MGLVDLITVSHWDMKRLHDGSVDRVEEGRHFGLGSSFKSIDFDQWHSVIFLFRIPSRIQFLDPRECHAAPAPVRILRARYHQFTGLNFWTLLPQSASAT